MVKKFLNFYLLLFALCLTSQTPKILNYPWYSFLKNSQFLSFSSLSCNTITNINHYKLPFLTCYKFAQLHGLTIQDHWDVFSFPKYQSGIFPNTTSEASVSLKHNTSHHLYSLQWLFLFAHCSALKCVTIHFIVVITTLMSYNIYY